MVFGAYVLMLAVIPAVRGRISVLIVGLIVVTPPLLANEYFVIRERRWAQVVAAMLIALTFLSPLVVKGVSAGSVAFAVVGVAVPIAIFLRLRGTRRRFTEDPRRNC